MTVVVDKQLQKIWKTERHEFACRIVTKIFRDAGLVYTDLANILMQGKTMLRMPAFDVSRGRMRCFIDVLAKTQSVWYFVRNEERHGLDRVKIEQYLSVAAKMRQRAGLAILELYREQPHGPPIWSGALLVQSFDALGKPIIGTGDQRHMAYWPRARFRTVFEASPDELLAIAAGELHVESGLRILQAIFDKPAEFQERLFD